MLPIRSSTLARARRPARTPGVTRPPAIAGTIEMSSPSLTLRVELVEEADVVAVEIDIDEAAHLALVVEQPLAHPGMAPFRDPRSPRGSTRPSAGTSSMPAVKRRSGVGTRDPYWHVEAPSLRCAETSVDRLCRAHGAVQPARARRRSQAAPAAMRLPLPRRSNSRVEFLQPRLDHERLLDRSGDRLERFVAVAGDRDHDAFRRA